jgi:hypothetical protein
MYGFNLIQVAIDDDPSVQSVTNLPLDTMLERIYITRVPNLSPPL